MAMPRKMDINDLSGVELWLQSLALLFHASEPLIYDCRRTDAEQKALFDDITLHVLYCRDVKDCLEHGRSPSTWDRWNEERNKILVEGLGALPVSIDTQSFGDVLTEIFGTSKGTLSDGK